MLGLNQKDRLTSDCEVYNLLVKFKKGEFWILIKFGPNFGFL